VDTGVLDRLPEAIVVLRTDGTVAACNDRARGVLGLTEHAIGRPASEVLVLHDDAGARCQLPPPVPGFGDRLPERVVQVVSPDGRSRPVALAGRFSPQDGWVLTVRPAGRREALERVHGDVVATVSHEIRSPLTSVKGFTRTLLTRWDRFSDGQKRALLETIDADADRVTRLLMDLLEVSRIDAGRVKLRRGPVDLPELALAVADKARHREEGHDRDLEVEVTGDVPTVRGDADRLEQVLTNLVDNALRYAPDSPVRLRLTAVDGGVEIEVSDEGPGVDPELHRAIFRKFARGRDHQRAGTGLGLYISRGLAEAHGGRIWLEERQGPGATFRVWVPVGDPPGSALAAAEGEDPLDQPLAVDDRVAG
jgi:signal transduction histidine kinase